jgi:acetoin utilization deacetylase AcuC-like enzyme
MLVVHNPEHARHAGRHEMFRGRLVDCHEVPQRLDHVLAELRRRGIGPQLAPLDMHAGEDAAFEALLRRVHAPRYLDFLARAWADWVALDPANAELDALPSVWPVRGFRSDVEPDNFAARLGLYSFDAGTPLTAGTWIAARSGAHGAVLAARAVASGSVPSAFALSRPPGHHAGADFMGGYCFLNNAAVAAQALRDKRCSIAWRCWMWTTTTATARKASSTTRADVLTVRQPPRRPAHRIPVLPGPCR